MRLEDMTLRVRQGLGLSKSFAERPDTVVWPDDPAVTREQVQNIADQLPGQDQKKHFFTLILTAAFLSPQKFALFEILGHVFQPSECGLDLTWPQIMGGRWLGVPLGVAAGEEGRIVYALIGTVPGMHGGAVVDHSNGLDPDCRTAVENAAKLARKKDYCFWFPDIYQIKVMGLSIGLPVYLGFRLLNNTGDWPNILCTGRLNAAGELSMVSGLEQKFGAAQEYGFAGVLYPDCGPVNPPGYLKFDLMPVSDCETALALVETYAQGLGRQHLFFYQGRQDIRSSIEHISDVDLKLLQFLEHKEAYLSTTVFPAIRENAELRDQLISRLKESMEPKVKDLHWTDFLLRTLFPLDVVRELAAKYPQQGFALMRMHFQVRNHQGLISELDTCHAILQECIHHLDIEKETEQEKTLHGIYTIVGGLHNRFFFLPEKAQNIVNKCSSAISKLENAFQAKKTTNPKAVNQPLGKYYGTMAQHYGFCGPEYIQTTLEFCDRAQEAFGNGVYQPMHKDWKRIFSYRFFAFLDAGDVHKAREELEQSLDCSLEDLEYDRMDQYEHHAFSRYLADSGQSNPSYHKWGRERMDTTQGVMPQVHPWQLWALNMGKLCDEPTLKRDLWHQSIAICNTGGPTMQIMALLPLACLYESGLEDKDVLKRRCERVLHHCRDSGLCTEHFEPLWTLPGDAVFAALMDNPDRFFPFSYR